MKKGYTHIAVLLDNSGSMSTILDDTIGGYNTFLKTQKEVPGECTYTLANFKNNGNYASSGITTSMKLVYDSVKLNDIPELNTTTFRPETNTPLYDTLCELIDHTGKILNDISEENKPEKVIFVVITDGQENASVKFEYIDVENRIRKQTDVYKWEFIYLGANQDAMKVGTHLGFSFAKSASYATDSKSIYDTYSTVGIKLASYRSSNAVDAARCLDFNDDERTKMLGGN